jgi:beta-glucosidase/6-phospho-beta-glucosidase/beta-galactosidase
MVAFDGYIAGTFPPYRKINFPLFGKVLKTLKKAHIIACDEVRKLPWTVKIGASNNWTYFDGIFGNILQKFFNEKLMRNFIGDEKPDFIALQYYCRATVPSFYPPIGKVRPKNRHYCDHPGWGDIYPEAMYIFLKRIQVLYPDTDIFITESGFADHADTKRPHWISETFKNVLKAKNEGVRVRGFLIWTPISNFEWEQGMDVDFGLTSESDLGKPLIPKPDKVAGWEMWEVISKTTKNPVVENIGSLDSLQKRAKWQFEKATKK